MAYGVKMVVDTRFVLSVC